MLFFAFLHELIPGCVTIIEKFFNNFIILIGITGEILDFRRISIATPAHAPLGKLADDR
jgi:hypothetical protein